MIFKKGADVRNFYEIAAGKKRPVARGGERHPIRPV
jgi:hypothetical protein